MSVDWIAGMKEILYSFGFKPAGKQEREKESY